MATMAGIITDQNALSYEATSGPYSGSAELFLDYAKRKIRLIRVGNLSANGVSMKCLYSKLKTIWKTNPKMLRYPFPMKPITDEQYELINGWDFDKDYSKTTSITITDCVGPINNDTVSTTTQDFIESNVIVGMYVSGPGIAPNTRVISVTAKEIKLSSTNIQIINGTLTFWTDSDYTVNLVRNGGWALKNTNDNIQEEWACLISSGLLGSQEVEIVLNNCSITSNSPLIARTSNEPIPLGACIVGPGIPIGAQVIGIDTNNNIVMTHDAIITKANIQIVFRQQDQIYYQNTANGPAINFALPGHVNQAIQVYGDSTHGNFNRRSYLKVYVREAGRTYSSFKLYDLNIPAISYQVYRFKLENYRDDKLVSDDVQIASNPIYSKMSITWHDTPQIRKIGNVDRSFHVIIDADTTLAQGTGGSATLEQIYEFVQYQLRKNANINSGMTPMIGNVTRELLRFIGDKLYTLFDPSDGGVYIDNFSATDANNIVFADDSGKNRMSPYVSAGAISFNSYLSMEANGNAIYGMYFNQLSNGRAYGTDLAEVVLRADNTTSINGFVNGATSISYDFDYDNNSQAAWTAATQYVVGDEFRFENLWYRVKTNYISETIHGALDVVNTEQILGPSIILAASGTDYAQYVSTQGIIKKSNSNNFSLVAASEYSFEQ